MHFKRMMYFSGIPENVAEKMKNAANIVKGLNLNLFKALVETAS